MAGGRPHRGDDVSAPHEQTTFSDLGKVLVIIPTYNESENIEGIVGRVRAATPGVDILVADDNSPDGTGALADKLAAADPHVQVLHRKGKEGLGAAYLAGFHWGIDRGYDILVEMDADGSHQPEQLPRLLEAVRDADLVLGSRWVPGGGIVNWPASRKFLSRGGSTYSRIMLGLDLRDITGGFRAFRKETLLGIDMDSVASQGYCFQVDLAWRAARRGYRIVEVPITFIERERGNSKMSRTIVAEALWRVTAWGAGRQVDRLRRTTPDEPRKGDTPTGTPSTAAAPSTPAAGTASGTGATAAADTPFAAPSGPAKDGGKSTAAGSGNTPDA
ncbi:polyprenol monophosphomannose synthase [Yinghuangia soli]|uniref:Polyprenol monophosphomannose synthase n=1 Tax=Yinghuangia soli TaxID=2908204 RepID=A0AA41Q6M0_9ACTN|nr:polyprenol monophosphomannose synthase [Yinghuangia soli]MCF2532226.1 polyprenol monophosphomannose synthase [Yinghuangia soli]